MAKQIGRGVRRLTVVANTADSGDASVTPESPAAQSAPRKTKAERDAQLALARANARKKIDERQRKVKAAKDAGIKSNLQRFRDGEYPVSDWTDEEVFKGRPINLDGTFGGGWPNFTGRQNQQIKQELLKRGQREIDSMYKDVVKVLHHVALYGDTDAARVKAADLLMQRTAGKVPDKIEFKSSDPWQDILDDIMDDEVLSRMTEPESEQA